MNWKEAITLMILLVMLYYYLRIKESEREKKTRLENYIVRGGQFVPVNHLLNFSSKDNKLLDQEYFSERVAKKRAYSMPEAMTNFLACIMEDIPGGISLLHQFEIQLYACMSLHIPIEKYELDMFKGINVEHKYFLPMDKAYHTNPSNKCFYLTVGIGSHTQAEKEFLKLYPTCKLFGVEIAPSNIGDFGNFGKVINVGIGFDMNVKVNQNYTYGTETYHNLTLKPFGMVGTNL